MVGQSLIIQLIAIRMGNQVCCDDLRQENPIEAIQAQDVKLSESHKPQTLPPPHPLPPAVAIPELSPQVRKAIQQPNFTDFIGEKIESEAAAREYGEDVYVGPVDENTLRPDGFGRMYKADGSLYVGSFSKGKANGLGAYAFANGAYFLGQFEDNQARCDHGVYETEGFKYSGGFRENQFWGKGKEEGERHSFEGDYVKGKRVAGTLKWREDSEFLFFYTGGFDAQEKFHGSGRLAETKGVYEGDFVNGVKEGQGTYKGVNGVKYRGSYKNGVKEGEGEIYNSDDSVCYKGEFKDGLPHGKGTAYNKDKVVEAQWIEGIDQNMLGQTTK